MTTRIGLGNPSEPSTPRCSSCETKAAANAVMVGNMRTQFERMQRDRLPTHRRGVAFDRVRSGRTNSAAATVVSNAKITSAGSNPGSLPGSGNGIVGAAAD
jgi:hypothetical protein